MIVAGRFDPISQKSLEKLKEMMRSLHPHDLHVTISGEGVLDKGQRLALLRKALAPFRHLHAVDCLEYDVLLTDEDEEAKIRSGSYYLAADGIRSTLARESLYDVCVAEAMCTPKRFRHSISVAETSAKYAAWHGLDVALAYRIGVLHDITKAMDNQAQKALLERYRPECLQEDPAIWHSRTAVIILKQQLGIYDHRILSAIDAHTIGTGKSDYARILYIADKTEPLRGYNTDEETRLTKISLAKGADRVLEKSKQYILEKEGKHV